MEPETWNRITKALEAYNILDITPNVVTPLNSLANQVWKIESKYVLRNYLKMTEEGVCQLQNILLYLQRKGIPIPLTMLNSTNKLVTCIDDRVFDLSMYIPHSPMKYPQMNIRQDQIVASARILSQVHLVPIDELPSNISHKEDELVPEIVVEKIGEFESKFGEINDLATPWEKQKLNLLLDIIKATSQARQSLIQRGGWKHFAELPQCLTHGDFSLTNLLPSNIDNKLYIIDWENMGIRPRIWELHRALLLICGRGKSNANFDELNFRRAKVFFQEYVDRINLVPDEIENIPFVAEYISSLHWLRFTLDSILRKDFRILTRIPDNVDQGLWWQKNLETYKQWIKTIFCPS